MGTFPEKKNGADNRGRLSSEIKRRERRNGVLGLRDLRLKENEIRTKGPPPLNDSPFKSFSLFLLVGWLRLLKK